MVESNPSTPTPTIEELEELEAAVAAADTASRDADEAVTEAVKAAIEASHALSAARRALKDARIAAGLDEENPVARSVKNTADQLRAMAETVETGEPGAIKPGLLRGFASVVEGVLPLLDAGDSVIDDIRSTFEKKAKDADKE